MKKKFGFSFAALSLMTLGLTGCQSEDVLPISSNNDIEMVHVVAVADAGNHTRTSKPMDDNGDLSFEWSKNDQIVIFTKDGATNCGVLKLKSGAGESVGTFEGQLGIPKSESEVHVYYFGANANNLSDIERSFDLDLSAQNGDYGHHVDYDVMHALSNITRGENSEVSLNFNIKGILSLAHFRLNLPEGSQSTADVTVNGKNMVSFATLDLATATFQDESKKCENITVTADWTKGKDNQGELYMAVVPGADIDTEFTVTTTDSKELKGAAKNRTYKENGFFNGASVNGKDIYFSEDGSWTLTYMDGEDVFYTDNVQNFGPSYTFTVTDQKPTKTAHVFVGWAESTDGEVVYYASDNLTLNRPNTEKTLYAIYNPDPTGTSDDMKGFDPTSN